MTLIVEGEAGILVLAGKLPANVYINAIRRMFSSSTLTT